MAWHPLGWEPAFFSEIDPAPRAVLTHHYPHVPLHGDFTTIEADEYGPIDLLVGGTPCQSFSVAGLRGGIHDKRGNLALEFLRLVDRKRPRWVVWENVPGVFSALSHDAPDFCPPDIDLDASNGPGDGEEVVVEDCYDSDESHAFACFLAGFSELGYGLAYRVLDAQFTGVPQRRRRVFVVGHLGDWRRAAAVLFERHSLQGHSPPRREAREGTAAGSRSGFAFSGQSLSAGDISGVAPCLDTGAEHHNRGIHVAHSLRAEGFDASEDGTGRGTPIVPVAFTQNSRSEVREIGGDGQIVGALAADAGAQQQNYVAFADCFNGKLTGDTSPTMGTRGSSINSSGPTLMQASAVRRLTPRECERLQGFPDDFTLVPYRGKPMADGPRYKMLGNSKAVPVVAWIGTRIDAVERIVRDEGELA